MANSALEGVAVLRRGRSIIGLGGALNLGGTLHGLGGSNEKAPFGGG